MNCKKVSTDFPVRIEGLPVNLFEMIAYITKFLRKNSLLVVILVLHIWF